MDEIRLTAYSFLTALADNGKDLYEAVYLPLCKRSLSRLAKNHREGTSLGLKQQIEVDYGLNIPEPLVRQFIYKIENSLSRKERASFELRIMEKGKSFQFDKFEFDKLEDEYERQRRMANLLNEAFEEYIRHEEIKGAPSFQEFLNQNKNKLSSFFSGKVESINEKRFDESFLPHAKFLRLIESSQHDLYKAAERAYLGTLIAAYFEAGLNTEAKVEKGAIYFIDTQVVLEALDLQDAQTKQPAIDLLELIASTGGKAKVLSITIEELQQVLQHELDVYNKDNPTTSIGEACKRTGKKINYLVDLKNNLEKKLQEQLKIEVEPVVDAKREEYESSKDVEQLVELKYKKNNAKHDVCAYLVVRNKRKTLDSVLPQKATVWFVSANSKLCYFNQKLRQGKTPEIIMPDELTSILFLKDTQRFAPIVRKNGLGALIAMTLTEEFADKDLINDFDTVVQENTDISETDYNVLLSYVAELSSSKLRNLIDEANHPEEFNSKIHTIIANTRRTIKEQAAKEKKRADEEARIKQENLDRASKNDILEKRLIEIESKMSSLTQDYDKVLKENKEYKTKENNNLLRHWKIRWCIFFVFILVLLILILLLCFIAKEKSWNVVQTLIVFINSLEGALKEWVSGLVKVIYCSVFILSVNGLISIREVKEYRERKGWFQLFLRKCISK